MNQKLANFVARTGERKLLWIIAAATFALQLIFMRGPEIYGEPYLVAKNIIAGKGFVFAYPLCKEAVTAYVTPLYVFLEVPILWLGLGERGVQIFNLLTLLAANLVLYRFWSKFTPSWLALVLFAALSLYVPFWILADSLDPNALNILLIALTIDRLYELDRSPTNRKRVQLGLLIGIQLLVRPDILLGAAVFGLWLLMRRWNVSTVKGIAYAAVIALLVVSPWTVRNYLTFHRFILVSANSGYNLYMGNNDVATGDFGMLAPTPESDHMEASIANFALTHDAVDVDRLRQHLAEKWMLTNPGHVVNLDIKKFYYHWFGRSLIGNLYHFGAGTYWTIYFVLSVFLIGFAGWGMYRLHDKRLRSLLIALFVYSTAVSVIFFVQSRHRSLKVDPFMVPLAVIGLFSIAGERIRSERSAEVASVTYAPKELTLT